MTLKNFLELYDNWNSIVTVNDNTQLPLISMVASDLYNCKYAFIDSKVVSFGFYDDELCIRINYVIN